VQAALAVRAMTDVLGLDPLDPHWTAGGGDGESRLRAALDALVSDRLTARADARAAKDWAAADAVRDLLTTAGIAVEDTPAGARWSMRHPEGDR